MRAIAQFIVKLADLAEAEGRLFRAGTVRIIIAAALAMGATLLGVAGLGLIVYSIFAWLQKTVLGEAGAALLCGLALLAVTFFLLKRVSALGSPRAFDDDPPPPDRTP